MFSSISTLTVRSLTLRLRDGRVSGSMKRRSRRYVSYISFQPCVTELQFRFACYCDTTSVSLQIRNQGNRETAEQGIGNRGESNGYREMGKITKSIGPCLEKCWGHAAAPA